MLESIFEWFSNRSAIPPLMWRDRKVFGMVEAWSQGRLYSKSCQGHWETLGDLFETPHAWNKDPALPGRPARAPGRHPDLPVPADSISQEISKVFLWSASTLNVRDLVQWHRSVSPPEDLQVRSISVAWLYNMISYCTIWYLIVQYDIILYNMIPYCIIWYHIV